MRRLLFMLLGPLAAALASVALVAGPAAAVSAHWVTVSVTSVTSNSITVSFKEAGLGNSLSSVNISLAGTAECINGGSNHPKATNKESVSASGTFNVSNGNATGMLTMTATLSPPCSPPMEICWTGLSITDTTFSDTADIPGTFCPSG
jgi:uncharacterized cupredoxin-like copper-binding protein